MSEETEDTGKIVSLADRREALTPPEPEAQPDPVPSVVELLECALVKARAGEILGVGIAYVSESAVGTNWAYAPKAMMKFELLSAADFLHNRIRSAIDSTGVPTSE